MSINDYLLDELLVAIFGYLSPFDRRNCRELCVRWNDLLINEMRFWQDWQLRLWYRLSPRERTLLKSSKCPFSSITLNKKSLNMAPYDEVKDLWDHLGETVTKMVVEKCGNEFYDVVQSFPLVKVLELGHIHPHEPKVFVMQNLENLKVGQFRYIEHLDLLQAFPKLNSLECKSVSSSASFTESFKKHPTVWKDLHWYENDKNFRDWFLKMENIKIERIYFHRGSYRLLSRIIELHPNVTDIPLNGIPPRNLQHRITSLNLNELDEEDLNFIPFASLTSLKKLFVEVSNEDCPIGHVIIPSPSLEELTFHSHNFDCSQCLETLTSSFPNLKRLSLSFEHFDTSTTELTNQLHRWKKLERLSFHVGDNVYQTIDSFHCDPHPTLKHLDISELDVNQFHGVLTHVPKLQTLKCRFDGKFKFGHLQEHLQYVPELKNLKIGILYYKEAYGLTEEDIQEMLSTIGEHSKKLRKLKIPVFYNKRSELVGKAHNLFAVLQKLQMINFFCIRRKCPYEVFEVFERAEFE